MAQLCSSNGNQVMSILHVDWNRACLKQVGTQYYELHPKRSAMCSTKEKKTLKIPGGRYEQRPVSETMTLVGKDPSNFSSALKKRRKFFLNWLLNIFWVRKWDLLYISISGFQIMSAGSLQRMSWFQFQVSLYRLYFYALQSSSFKYIYLWLYSLCIIIKFQMYIFIF